MGALGLPSSAAADYQECVLCKARVDVRYNSGEGLGEAMARLQVPEECPNGVESPVGGKKIFAFCNGGGGQCYEALSICEDGHVVAQHICSSPGWCKHDLGIGSTWKHDQYSEHCPDGYELIWVDDPRGHAGLQAAAELNRKLKSKAEPEETK